MDNRPCPECSTDMYWSYICNAFWCERCEQNYTESDIDALELQKTHDGQLAQLRAQVSALETEIRGTGKILDRLDKTGSWGVMVDAAKLQEMEARIAKLEAVKLAAEAMYAHICKGPLPSWDIVVVKLEDARKR